MQVSSAKVDRPRRPQFIEMDDLHLSETAYLNVPDRDKSPSPADSVHSSVSDISTLPIHGRRRDEHGVRPTFDKLSIWVTCWPIMFSLKQTDVIVFCLLINDHLLDDVLAMIRLFLLPLERTSIVFRKMSFFSPYKQLSCTACMTFTKERLLFV